MLAVSGVNFKSNYKTTTTGKNSYPILNRQYEKTNTDTIILQKPKQIAFKGMEELSPKLDEFWQRFEHITRELDGAIIAKDEDIPENFLMSHQKDKMLPAIGKYLHEKEAEINKIVSKAKPDDIEGLINELSLLREKFSFTFGFPTPFVRIRPNNGAVRARISDKPITDESLYMVYNPELYEFLKSGKLFEAKYVVDNGGKFFTLGMNPGIAENKGQIHNYIDLFVEPV